MKQVILDLTDSHNGVLADERLIVTVHNNGAGPFLGIRTETLFNPEIETGMEMHEISIESEQHIDDLANALKKLLREANEMDQKGEK